MLFNKRLGTKLSPLRVSCVSFVTHVDDDKGDIKVPERERARSGEKEAGRESGQSSECGNEELKGGGLGG